MTSVSLRFAAATAALLALVSGACRPRTELILVVDTNLGIPSELDAVRIEIDGPTRDNTPLELPLGRAAPAFPLSLGLESEGELEPVHVRVSGSLGGEPVVQQEVRTGFVRGDTRVLSVLLLRECVGVACEAEQTCRAGACDEIAVDGSSLPEFDGDLPRPSGERPQAPEDPPTLWAGAWHTCALRSGELYCWGKNDEGQLGEGGTLDQSIRRPTALEGVVDACGGGFHSCAVVRGGGLFCWGSNDEGQLGTPGAGLTLSPTAVPGLDDVVRVACGRSHTCALRSDARVWCWGSNTQGQLGSAPGDPQPEPRAVPGVEGAIGAASGGETSCALFSDGSARCWGANGSGQLGDGTTVSRHTPELVSGLERARELALGTSFACAREFGGGVSCWGDNESGTVGDGTLEQRLLPTAVMSLHDALLVRASASFVCVLRGDNSVGCWGRADWGNMGDGTTGPAVANPEPSQVLEIGDAIGLAVGGQHACVRRSGGGLACWGLNENGQLGDGTGENRSRPVSVSGMD